MQVADSSTLRASAPTVSAAAWWCVLALPWLIIELRLGSRIDLVSPLVGLALLAYAMHRLRRLDPPPAAVRVVVAARAAALVGFAVELLSQWRSRSSGTLTLDPRPADTADLVVLAGAQLATMVTLVLVAAAFAGVTRWLLGATGRAVTWRRTAAFLALALLPAQLVWSGLRFGVRWGIVAPPEGAWVSIVFLGVPFVALVVLAVTLLRTPGGVRPWTPPRPDAAQLEAEALRADRGNDEP